MDNINQDTHTGPSFSVRNRAARVLWNGVAAVLFRPSPRPFHAWRSMLLRCFGARVGAGVHVCPKVSIWAPWNLELADQAGVADGVTLYSQGRITIGRRAVISQGAHLCAGSHDYTQDGFPLVTAPIVIGAEVWIAAEAFIHPGVTVGEGSVIGARSVVTKDMPPWMVCSGHPCVVLKPRILQKENEL
jgi:putative colanic acid biosynthesis acetyltransferase WcaF